MSLQPLRFQVLGPLEVFRAGKPCTPRAPKQRALLALLLLHANELLPTNRIIDELWGYRPPTSAVAALQMYVSGVRRALVPHTDLPPGDSRRHPVLRTQPSGYVMRVEPDQLDLARYRSLAVRGRMELAEGRCQESGDAFRHALSLWRGEPLADLSRTTTPLQQHVARLEEERMVVLQARIGVDICQGRSREVVGELEEICFRHPLREDFHQQLMLALYLAGRRADALSAYTRLYKIMVDEAGIEPGLELREIQQAVLRGLEPSRGIHDCHGRRRSA